MALYVHWLDTAILGIQWAVSAGDEMLNCGTGYGYRILLWSIRRLLIAAASRGRVSKRLGGMQRWVGQWG